MTIGKLEYGKKLRESVLETMEKTNELVNAANDLLKMYPIGAIYQSTSSTDPSTLFGGTWQQITDVFLVAKGSSFTGTGGSKTHNHKYGFRTHMWYGSVIGGDYNAFQIGDYTNDKWLTGTSDGSNTANRNSALQAGTTSGSSTLVQYTGVTSSDSNIPPYYAVYTWRRTA